VNLWRGWGCLPIKGNVQPFLNLIARLCNFNEAEIEYLIWRFAIKIQNPWMKIPSYTIVVAPDEGTGKSQLGKFIAGLYGVHGKIITDREMESKFDDWKAAGILFAVAEEVSFKEKRSVANHLKALASMEVDHINPKGQPAYQVDNFLDYFLTANIHDAIYIRNERERRPFVVMHDPITPMAKIERDELQAWYDNGGKEALLHHLMHEVDGRAFDPYEPAPLTAGKTEMAEAGRNPAEQFVADLIADAIEDKSMCPLQDFSRILKEYAGARTPDKRDEAALSHALRASGSISRRRRFDTTRTTLYPIRDMAEWKRAPDVDWIKRYRAYLGLPAYDE
jgi:hypothetical protein